MAFTLGATGGFLLGLLSNFWTWILLLFGFVAVAFLMLYIRRRRKLVYPAIEFTDMGSKKAQLNIHKAGWFKSKSMFFKLWDYGGEDVLQLDDGRVIQGGSNEDFHEVDEKRAVLVARKASDPEVLVQIKELELDANSKKLLSTIAGADLRDTANKLLDRNDKETRNKWEKVAPYIALGVIAIVLLVSIIVITQTVKSSNESSTSLILEIARSGCNSQAVQDIMNVSRGLAP